MPDSQSPPMQSKTKRKYTKRSPKWDKKPQAAPVSVREETPVSPLRIPLDPLEQAQAAMRNAQEGNVKLARALEVLRTGLETIVQAEIDNETGLPVTSKDLRMIAVNALDAYSHMVGQNWRANRIKESYAGDRNIKGLDGYS